MSIKYSLNIIVQINVKNCENYIKNIIKIILISIYYNKLTPYVRPIII